MTTSGLVREDELHALSQAEWAAQQALHPFQKFVRRQTAGGVMLLFCAVLAFAWANSPWALAYGQMLHEPFGISFGEHLLRLDLRHWINDGLMAVFFFTVGLEIKRELLVGELAERQKALLPLAAAIGGMIVPALCYFAFNAGGPGAHGWGIPIATDIAFALAVLAILGSRIPESLKVFLVALAIVDDLGALLVIAVFYTASVEWDGILAAVACLMALFIANRAGARQGSIYLLLGLCLWVALFSSGLHATLAGVLTAMFIPTRVKILSVALVPVIRRSAELIEAQTKDGQPDAMDPERFAAIDVLSSSLDDANSPLQRFERGVQPWVNFFILPVFALFNAGVAVDATLLRALGSAVPLGIIVGMVVGKPLGICLASWLAVTSGVAVLPEGVLWRHVAGTAFLAGIGFTMALFVTGLAFTGIDLANEAKLAILVASVLAAFFGITILLVTTRTTNTATHLLTSTDTTNG